MFAKIQDFFVNRLLGKLLASAAASIVGYAATGIPGAQITLDPVQVAAALGALAHMVLDLIQHNAKPATPPAPGA